MYEREDLSSGVEVTEIDLIVATADQSDLPSDRHITKMLDYVRNKFKVDVAFVARFVNGRRVISNVSAAPADARAVKPDHSDEVEATYCQRVVDGRLPRAIKDARRLPETAALEVTDKLEIGAYLCVPVITKTGAIYGTVCCYNHRETPEFGDRAELDVLEKIAAYIAGTTESGIDTAIV